MHIKLKEKFWKNTHKKKRSGTATIYVVEHLQVRTQKSSEIPNGETLIFFK